MTEIDVTTNMPVVPEGYFWKVTVYWGDYDKCPSATVSLRKKRRIGSKVIAWMDDFLAVRDPNVAYELIRLLPEAYPKAIRELAEKVLRKNEKQLHDADYYARFAAAKKNLSGSYPPKKLEN